MAWRGIFEVYVYVSISMALAGVLEEHVLMSNSLQRDEDVTKHDRV